MFEAFTSIYGQPYQTYTIAILLAVLLSIVWLVLSAREGQASATFDACLAALLSAVLLGRAFHVALNWLYFGENLNMIVRIHEQGGLNWHGALLGAALAGALVAKWRGLNLSELLLRLTPILPLMAFAAWYACAAAACAYGTSIQHMSDYPAFLSWIERDIYGLISPRFAVQPIGMAWTALLFLLALFLQWRNLFPKRRLPLLILLLCIGSFMLAFLRGDYALSLASLRAEQWLDLILAGLTIYFLIKALKLETA